MYLCLPVPSERGGSGQDSTGIGFGASAKRLSIAAYLCPNPRTAPRSSPQNDRGRFASPELRSVTDAARPA